MAVSSSAAAWRNQPGSPGGSSGTSSSAIVPSQALSKIPACMTRDCTQPL